MGHNSASANCRHVSLSIWWVSGRSINAAPEKLDEEQFWETDKFCRVSDFLYDRNVSFCLFLPEENECCCVLASNFLSVENSFLHASLEILLVDVLRKLRNITGLNAICRFVVDEVNHLSLFIIIG